MKTKSLRTDFQFLSENTFKAGSFINVDFKLNALIVAQQKLLIPNFKE
jgi:hypothetical protein